MITQRTIVDQIEVMPSGHVQIRFGKIVEEDGVETECYWHRTVVEPGVDPDAQIAAVRKHLATPEMGGFPAPDAEGVARVKAVAGLVHTPAVVAAHRERGRRGPNVAPSRPNLTGLMQRRTRVRETVIKRDGTLVLRCTAGVEDNGVEIAPPKDLLPVVVEPGQDLDTALQEAGIAPSEPSAVQQARALTELIHAPFKGKPNPQEKEMSGVHRSGKFSSADQ